MHALRRSLMDAKSNARLYRLSGEEALNVSPKLRHVFGTSRRGITIHCLIDNRLRQVGIEVACSALSNQNGRVTICLEVFAVGFPQRPASRVRRADSN